MASLAPHKTLILACGALAQEIMVLKRMLSCADEAIDVQCLPADYHNMPDKIVPALADILTVRGSDYDHILIGYGDCGTGGGLDRLLMDYANAERLPGSHCYEFFSGPDKFARLMEEEIGSFFLTDYMVRHFERIIIKGLGLDRFPHLTESYFKNYKRLVYISQIEDAELMGKARNAADRLGLSYAYHYVGYGGLATAIEALDVEKENFNV